MGLTWSSISYGGVNFSSEALVYNSTRRKPAGETQVNQEIEETYLILSLDRDRDD